MRECHEARMHARAREGLGLESDDRLNTDHYDNFEPESIMRLAQ